MLLAAAAAAAGAVWICRGCGEEAAFVIVRGVVVEGVGGAGVRSAGAGGVVW
jgi:hypothetical protein